MASRLILPAIALSGLALAQNSACSGDMTIESSADATALASCTTYRGNVEISEQAAGIIAINGVRSIDGDLICQNATQLTAITSDQLNSISGTFRLLDLTILSTLQFSSLSAVNHIEWVGLPQLQALQFDQGISTANTVEISNTQLNSLTGIELTAVTDMDVNNNPYLATINVNDMMNVSNALSFSANGRDLEISFPNLGTAGNLTFRNVSKIDMPSLEAVDGSIGFYSDTFESFSAPNLTETGGSLAFVDSPKLSNLSFPQLTTIGGGFLIANNTALKAIDGFPKLKTIVGALDFAGTFSKLSLPAIGDVRGGANVQTTADNSNLCSDLDSAHDSGIIKGDVTCKVGTSNPQAMDPSSSGSSSGSAESSGAANPSFFDPSTPMTGVWAIIAALLFI